jgi:peptidoglycan/LPS O-acetylase OafA/YrhL
MPGAASAVIAAVEPRARRQPAIDVIKAAAILAVVVIHSLRPFWLPEVSDAEKMVLLMTRFGVPAFLAASGFLYYSREAIPFSVVGRRLRRVVVPYGIASVAAVAYGWFHPNRLTADSFSHGLLLGAFFGPYYYVFLLVAFILATWVLSRLPERLVTWLAAAAVVTVVARESWTPEMWKPFTSLWQVRHPLLWAGWCLLGWTAAAHRDAVNAYATRQRTVIMATCMGYAAAWAVALGTGLLTGRLARASVVLLILATICGLYALGSGRSGIPAWVESLSDRTYSLYLLHPFFIYYVQDAVAPALGLTPAVWVPLSAFAGLTGALAVTVAARRCLGAWSRDIVGS